MNQHFRAYSAVFPVFLRTRGGRRQVQKRPEGGNV